MTSNRPEPPAQTGARVFQVRIVRKCPNRSVRWITKRSCGPAYALRMARRLVIPSREEVDGELPVAHSWWQFSVRFNVAISQSVPVARMHERESEGVVMRWGLAQKTACGSINFTNCGAVRRDTLESAQNLHRMWTDGQRGIVPLAGFYVWQRVAAGYHQPHYVRLVNRAVFGVAAIWERAEANDEVIESCALITVDANPLLTEIDPMAGQMPIRRAASTMQPQTQ